MNSKVLYLFGGLLVGLGSGAAGMYFFMKERMETRIEAEVSEVKEVYSKVKNGKKAVKEIFKEKEEKKEAEEPKESPRDIASRNKKLKEEIITNSNIIAESKYTDTHKTEYNLFSKPPKAVDIHNGIDEGEDLDIIDTTPPEDAGGPYVLETDELSTASDKFVNEEPYFDKVTLFYFDDGVLCSEDEEVITNFADTIGTDSLNRIGEYEPDVVYVRNEKTSTDYEVVRQYRNFMDIPEDDS